MLMPVSAYVLALTAVIAVVAVGFFVAVAPPFSATVMSCHVPGKCVVLVTGAAGFIGMHTAVKFSSMGHTVIGVDNLETRADKWLVAMRLKSLSDHNITFLKQDVCVTAGNLLSTFLPDVVVHLAGHTGVRDSVRIPQKFVSNNVECFVALLEALRKTPARLLYASSSSVYGSNIARSRGFTETDRVDNQVSVYAVTKKSMEATAKVYHSLYGISSIGMRFFTVYGPFGRPDMAVWTFTDRVLRGKPVIMFNNGIAMRDFTYVSDVVSCIVEFSSMFNDGAAVFNVGTGTPVMVADMLRVIERATGFTAHVRPSVMSKADVVYTKANMDKTYSFIHHRNRVSIDQGVVAFVNWYTMAINMQAQKNYKFEGSKLYKPRFIKS
jgi:UDP-glucuronate 4-epimerase